MKGRAINTTAEHPYLVTLYDKELCSKYAGDIWNKEADEFNGYCTRWVEVKELKERMRIAVPKSKYAYSMSNNFLISSVEKISTSDCSLNLFSLDQIAQADDNANAKYGISLVCPGSSPKALDSNFLNSALGTTSIISESNAKDIMNSKPPMPQNLQIFCFKKYNSSNAKSGTISLAPLRYTDLSRFLVKDSGLKNENNIDASTTINLICNTPYEDTPYLLAKLSRYSSTSSEKLSSESLLFFKTPSTTLNNSKTLSFSSIAPLNNALVAGFLSSSPIISLNLSGISIFNSTILLSQKPNNGNDYLNVLEYNKFKSFDSDIIFDEIASIKPLPPQHVYDLSIEGTRNFIANDIVAHNTYLTTSSGNVGIGIANPTSTLHVIGTGNFSGNLYAGSCTNQTSPLNQTCTDIAELFSVENGIEAGEVVCLKENGKAGHCDKAFDSKILGVISTNPAIVIEGGDILLGKGEYSNKDKMPIALKGRVPIKAICDTPIKKGDLLVSSKRKGYAIKKDLSGFAMEEKLDKIDGTTIGKALEECKNGEKMLMAWIG